MISPIFGVIWAISGNTTLTGNVKESGARLENALINGGGNLKGIGSTLEGLDVMQFPYEYILESMEPECR